MLIINKDEKGILQQETAQVLASWHCKDTERTKIVQEHTEAIHTHKNTHTYIHFQTLQAFCLHCNVAADKTKIVQERGEERITRIHTKTSNPASYLLAL